MKKLSLRMNFIIALFSSILLILIDQISKYLVVIYLSDGAIIDIIPGVFCLKYLENRGAAFGMLQGQQGFFIIMTIIVLIAVPYIFSKIPLEPRFHPLRICLVLLISGAIGNMIDRIRLNYVVDFLYFELIDFPIFNVADIYVTVTTGIFIVLLIFVYKEEELEGIHLWKKKEK